MADEGGLAFRREPGKAGPGVGRRRSSGGGRMILLAVAA